MAKFTPDQIKWGSLYLACSNLGGCHIKVTDMASLQQYVRYITQAHGMEGIDISSEIKSFEKDMKKGDEYWYKQLQKDVPFLFTESKKIPNAKLETNVKSFTKRFIAMLGEKLDDKLIENPPEDASTVEKIQFHDTKSNFFNDHMEEDPINNDLSLYHGAKTMAYKLEKQVDELRKRGKMAEADKRTILANKFHEDASKRKKKILSQ